MTAPHLGSPAPTAWQPPRQSPAIGALGPHLRNERVLAALVEMTEGQGRMVTFGKHPLVSDFNERTRDFLSAA